MSLFLLTVYRMMIPLIGGGILFLYDFLIILNIYTFSHIYVNQIPMKLDEKQKKK